VTASGGNSGSGNGATSTSKVTGVTGYSKKSKIADDF